MPGVSYSQSCSNTIAWPHISGEARLIYRALLDRKTPLIVVNNAIYGAAECVSYATAIGLQVSLLIINNRYLYCLFGRLVRHTITEPPTSMELTRCMLRTAIHQAVVFDPWRNDISLTNNAGYCQC